MTSRTIGMRLGPQALARAGRKAPKLPEPDRYCHFSVSEVLLLASHKPALIVLAIMRAYPAAEGMRLEEIGRRTRFGGPRTERAVAKLMALGFIETSAPTGKGPRFTLTERGRGELCHPLKGSRGLDQQAPVEQIGARA